MDKKVQRYLKKIIRLLIYTNISSELDLLSIFCSKNRASIFSFFGIFLPTVFSVISN